MKKLTKRILSAVLAAVLCLSVMPFAFAASIRGDANFDGSVNSTDALIILQYSVGKEIDIIDEYLLDLNGDGQVNSSDALRALKISVGSDDPLKYGTVEILKFYSDAMMTSFFETTRIEYSTKYDSVFYDADDTDYNFPIEDYWSDTAYFTDGYSEESGNVTDYCPLTWIDEAGIQSAAIEKISDGYKVTIKLIYETESYDIETDEYVIAPYNYDYAYNSVSCSVSLFEDFYVIDGTAIFPGTVLTATVSEAGYMTSLNISIPFEIHTYMEDSAGEYYINGFENGTLTDNYMFYFN